MKHIMLLSMLIILTFFALPVMGETNTGLDRLTTIILNDTGLRNNIPAEEIVAGADAASRMNEIIIKSIRATNAWMNGYDQADLYLMNQYIRANYLEEWTLLHGDDENGDEWGFHYVQNDGATSQLYGENAVNTVADGVYHLGFEIVDGALLNEDGDANVRLSTLAMWLNDLFVFDDFKTVQGVYGSRPQKLEVSGLRVTKEYLSVGESMPISISMEGSNIDSASVRVTCFDLGVSKVFKINAVSDRVNFNGYMDIPEHVPGVYTCRVTITANNGLSRTKHRDITLI